MRSLLFLILLLALIIRLALWWLPLHQLANDEIEYVTVAFDLLEGRGWQFYEHYHWLRAPLYPLFLAGSLALSRGDLHLAGLPNIGLSMLNVVLAYAIAYQVGGTRRIALVAASLAALLLTLATFASLYMLETLFATLLSTTLLLLLYYRHRPHAALAATAGVLLGLAALTRSLALPLLIIGGVYILLVQPGQNTPTPNSSVSARLRAATLPLNLRRSLLHAASFGLACLLTIAPWTIRNYLAYERFILVETGLAFNVWAFNEPREDMATIFRELEAIANPAERADYATAKGTERLRADPAILLRKLDDNWYALWRVKPIEDRFIQQDYYSDVGLGYFLASLLLDDALILLIMLAGAVGLVLAPGWQARLLLGGWLLATVASILLTHGEARYRHALLPALLPYAAWTIGTFTQRFSVQRTVDAPGSRSNRTIPLGQAALIARAAALGLAMVLGWSFLTSYPWQWAGQRVGRGLLQLQGDIASWRNDPAAALAAYARAVQAQPDSVDALLVLGRAQAARYASSAAARLPCAAWRLRPTYVPASTLLGDLRRQRGDQEGARRAFAGAYAYEQEIVDWAWANLDPAPVSRIDVGDGLDLGYIGGVYPAERQQGHTARWTDGTAMVQLPAAPAGALLRLRLAAPHPSGGAVTAQICSGTRCQSLQVVPTWRSYTLTLGSSAGAEQQQVIRIISPTFDSLQDGRRLGILIDWVSLTPLQAGNCDNC